MRSNFGLNRPQLPRKLDATTAIVGLLGAGALLTLLAPRFAEGLFFVPSELFRRPWSAITYPLVIPIEGGLAGPIFTLFLLLWTYQLGRQLEPAMGVGRFLALWAFGVLAPVLLFLVPGLGAPLAGPMMPVALLTVVWAARSPEAPVLLLFFPLAAKWIAALIALGVFATYYPVGAIVAVAALLPLAVGWAFGRGAIPGLGVAAATRFRPTKEQLRREAEFRDEVAKRRQDRDERERLRRLLEGPAASDVDER